MSDKIFPPFYNLIVAIFVYFLIIEILEKVGLAPAKAKSK